MKKTLERRQFAGFLFTVTLGALLHFIFVWSGDVPAVGALTAVNESTWEHMKLLFIPSFLWAIVEFFSFGRKYTHFWRVKLLGSLVGLILIPAQYYTVSGIFGSSPDWFNILSFFTAALSQFLVETHILCGENKKRADHVCEKKARCVLSERAAFAALCVIALAFVLFTYFPPPIPLFRDPVTGRYGIPEIKNAVQTQAAI